MKKSFMFRQPSRDWDAEEIGYHWRIQRWGALDTTRTERCSFTAEAQGALGMQFVFVVAERHPNPA
jgi:hypothetical protein